MRREPVCHLHRQAISIWQIDRGDDNDELATSIVGTAIVQHVLCYMTSVPRVPIREADEKAGY